MVLLDTLVGHILDMIAVNVLDRKRVGKVSIHILSHILSILSHSHIVNTLDHTEDVYLDGS